MSRKERFQKKSEIAEVKARLKNLLLFLPNLVVLLGRLLKDKRVPLTEKALFLAAITYVLVPLDFLPDFFPFLGQVDDLYLVALTILRLINRTDANVVREHWAGGGDIVTLAETIATIAPILLPRRVSRVITSRVGISKPNELINSLPKGRKHILKEVPE